MSRIEFTLEDGLMHLKIGGVEVEIPEYIKPKNISISVDRIEIDGYIYRDFIWVKVKSKKW